MPAVHVEVVVTVTGTLLLRPSLSYDTTVYVVVCPAVNAVSTLMFSRASIDSEVFLRNSVACYYVGTASSSIHLHHHNVVRRVM